MDAGSFPTDRPIPVRLLAAPILCAGHNGKLSPLDAAAGAFVAALRRPVPAHLPTVLEVDGALLERWCLKALLGIAAAGWHRPHRKASHLATAPLELAEIAFGLRPFAEGTGLQVVSYSAELPTDEERVSWRLLVSNAEETAIAGLLVGLPPVVLALALLPGDVGALVRQLRLPGFLDWRDVETAYRPRDAVARSTTGAAIRIRLRWPESNGEISQ